MVLAFLSIVGGLILGFPPEHGWLHGFLGPVVGVGGEHEASAGMVVLLMSVALVIALMGWGLAHFLYAVSPATSEGWAERFSAVYRILLNKYYVDELYDLLFVEPLKRLGAILDWFDRTVIDGLVRGVGRAHRLGCLRLHMDREVHRLCRAQRDRLWKPSRGP